VRPVRQVAHRNIKTQRRRGRKTRKHHAALHSSSERTRGSGGSFGSAGCSTARMDAAPADAASKLTSQCINQYGAAAWGGGAFVPRARSLTRAMTCARERRVCAVCDEACSSAPPRQRKRRAGTWRHALTPLAARMDGGDLVRVGHPKLTWTLAALPDVLLQQYQVIDEAHPLVSELVLSPKGASRSDDGSWTYDVCVECMSSLEGTSSNPPPLALANGMVVGNASGVAPELQAMTPVEASCCALVNVKGAVEFITQGGSRGNMQVKGHVLG